MSFIYKNIAIKKISYGRRKGVIHIKVEDEHYNVIFKGSAKLNDKEELRTLRHDLKAKGFDLFKEASWF